MTITTGSTMREQIARNIIGRVLAATSSREEQYARILGELAAHVGDRWPALPDPAIMAKHPELIREAMPVLCAALTAAERDYRGRSDALRMLLDQVEGYLGTVGPTRDQLEELIAEMYPRIQVASRRGMAESILDTSPHGAAHQIFALGREWQRRNGGKP